ncbi:MAG TPA: hypothetical protein VJS92_04590 [Candidatus Polarisedimenticolaceae bacterium]|nr:hypothetical protein [Candidatus Polarisedimenticolaceae bacterium]
MRFIGAGTMSWSPLAGASSYDVYRKVRNGPPPTDAGSCLLVGIAGTSTSIPGIPAPGETWLLLVAGFGASGESSLGLSVPSCAARVPAQSCGP